MSYKKILDYCDDLEKRANNSMNLFFKRLFDVTISFIFIFILLPAFLLISLLIKLDSSGPIFFKQIRIGKNGIPFTIFKFRTMIFDKDNITSQLTTNNDKRITKVGKFLRKSKVDELPQLINVLFGSMSFVGPRPEVFRYVNLYNEEQKKVLLVKPGITDLASIVYRDENSLLPNSESAEEIYINQIMPKKINLNLFYISKMNVFYDIKIILKTLLILFFSRRR